MVSDQACSQRVPVKKNQKAGDRLVGTARHGYFSPILPCLLRLKKVFLAHSIILSSKGGFSMTRRCQQLAFGVLPGTTAPSMNDIFNCTS